MATFRTRSSGTVEACIRRKTLPGPIYLTFKTEKEARSYCAEAEALIDAGKIPPALLEFAGTKKVQKDRPEAMAKTIGYAIDQFISEYSVTEGDKQWLSVLKSEIGLVEIGSVTVQWALGRIKAYKIEKNLTPATIRHRIGALRRCFDWNVTAGNMPINPLQMLPTRYASYNDIQAGSVGTIPADDNSRDRRLEPGEEERIRKVLANDPEYIESICVERGISPDSEAAMTLLFDMALETAMRLREMFTLHKDQIDIGKRTIFLDRTKNGDKRQVPLSSVMAAALDGIEPTGKDGLIFPWWNGDLSPAVLRRVSSKLSGRWRTVARLAKCDGLRFHDLRHEATSRLFERTTMTEMKIAKITGHRDMKSLQRYANLRASSLADEMW